MVNDFIQPKYYANSVELFKSHGYLFWSYFRLTWNIFQWIIIVNKVFGQQCYSRNFEFYFRALNNKTNIVKSETNFQRSVIILGYIIGSSNSWFIHKHDTRWWKSIVNDIHKKLAVYFTHCFDEYSNAIKHYSILLTTLLVSKLWLQ